MSFIPHSKLEWIQQGKLAVFVLALFGYIFFLMEGLSTGLGVYRNPTYCWVAAVFAILALVVASRPQRWVAIAALVAAILSSLYGYHANAAWKDRLERAQTKESAQLHTTEEIIKGSGFTLNTATPLATGCSMLNVPRRQRRTLSMSQPFQLTFGPRVPAKQYC